MTRFSIDPDVSTVRIDARSTLHPIHSETSGLTGFIDVDFDDDGQLDLGGSPSGRLSLPVDRLRSGNVLEERELKRRILARQFPTIDGELVGITSGSEKDHYRVAGTVTFRGVTCTYEHEMVIDTVDREAVRLTGEAVFDVRDFGMEPPRILMLRVEPEVTVSVDITATRTQ